jgi:hypothetical protein
MERRHRTGIGSPTLQTLQDPVLLLPWACFRGGGVATQNHVKGKLSAHRGSLSVTRLKRLRSSAKGAEAVRRTCCHVPSARLSHAIALGSPSTASHVQCDPTAALVK